MSRQELRSTGGNCQGDDRQESCSSAGNCRTIALISHASKVMLKILQARLQQYVHRELPDVQAGFRKGRRTRDQIANISVMDMQGQAALALLVFFILRKEKNSFLFFPFTATCTT